MPAKYCRICNRWFRRSLPYMTRCDNCHKSLKTPSRWSFAHVRAEHHVPRSITQPASVPRYCLKHHAFGHWEGEECIQPSARTHLVLPSLKLRWKVSEEIVSESTSRPIPATRVEVMAHLQKINEWTIEARSIVLARDQILKHIRSIVAQQLDDAAVQQWHSIMAQAAYGTRGFLCELLSLIHRARNRLVEVTTSGEMAMQGEWQHIAYSHFAVADYLETTPNQGSKSIDRDEFNAFLRRIHYFADSHLTNRDVMVADIEAIAKTFPDVATSFAMKELFQFPVNAMPTALRPILRGLRGIHILMWPDMSLLQQQVQLVTKSVNCTA